MNDHAEQFILESEIRPESLLQTNISWDDNRVFVTYDQIRERVPVLGGDVVIVLDSDCTLISLNGAFQFDEPVPLTARLADVDQDLDYKTICESESKLGALPPLESRASLRTVFVPGHGVGHEYMTANYTCILDAMGDVVSMKSNWDDAYVADEASVTRGTYSSTSLDARSAFVSSTITVGRNDWFGDCTWELSYVFNPGPLNRVKYNPGSPVEVQGPCSSVNPTFSSANRWAAGFRQQEAYYSLRMARSYLVTYMWDVFSPTQKSTDGVEANTDMGWPYCGPAPACYSPTTTDIYTREFDDDNVMLDHRIDSYVHEYGHHIVETYGGLGSGNTCSGAVDQSDAINETLADVMAMIVMTVKFSAAYNASWSRIGVGGERHFGGGESCTSTSDCSSFNSCISGICRNIPVTYSCSTGAEVHSRGRAFEHAIWELIHNQDCSSNPSACKNIAFGGAINPCWTDAEGSRMIARAVAYALKSTGTSVSFPQIANAIISDLSVSQGVTCGVVPHQNADAVFAHHGL